MTTLYTEAVLTAATTRTAWEDANTTWAIALETERIARAAEAAAWDIALNAAKLLHKLRESTQ